MKKAVLVEFTFVTRIVIDESEENFKTIIAKTKQKIVDKAQNNLEENFIEWYDDTDRPYNENEETNE